MADRDNKLGGLERTGDWQDAGIKPLQDPAPRGSGGTQKMPSDSDLLGLRTDSDRFIVKTLPETLPADAKPLPNAANEAARKTILHPKEQISSQDALTIALNVNVFANLQKNTDGTSNGPPGDDASDEFLNRLLKRQPSSNAAPLSKDPAKTPISNSKIEPFKITVTQGQSGNAAGFTRDLNSPAPPNAPASPDTEFTRILHMQDVVKVPTSSITTEENAATLAPESSTPLSQPAPMIPPGASDFTRVIKGSDLRNLQEKLAAAAAVQPASWPATTPGNSPNAAAPAANSWQAAAPAMPEYVAPNTWPPAPPNAQPVAQPPSKLTQYMPLIVLFNLLFLMAVLLIVFFAVRK